MSRVGRISTFRATAVLAALVIFAGCAGVDESAPAEASTVAPVSPALVATARFASHLFVRAGDTRDISGLGVLVETIHMEDGPAAEINGNTLTALTSGSTCFRFKYRSDPAENEVQTLCALVAEETGECDDLPLARLNLEAFLDARGHPVGNANLLEAGRRTLYAICVTPEGRYRLQQPDRALPPLYH
ncbi:MAG: hypothetical protein O3B65_02095 [Chloroflexi bacterium]|nr:hypothetical protein [Chloroflexota bacterium]